MVKKIQISSISLTVSSRSTSNVDLRVKIERIRNEKTKKNEEDKGECVPMRLAFAMREAKHGARHNPLRVRPRRSHRDSLDSFNFSQDGS